MNQARKTKAQLLEELGELRRRASELAASEERFRAIFETAQDPIFVKNGSLEYTQVNPAMERLFGVRAAELIGRTDQDLFGQDVAARIRAVDARVLGGETVKQEHTKPVQGVLCTFHVIKVPMRDSSGQVIGLYGIARDITERRRAEDALRAASQYTRSLIEASLDPLVTISPRGKITDVNRATETVTGVPRQRLIGSDFSDYFTEPAKAQEGYQQVFSAGTVSDYALTIRHASGRLTDVLYNASVYRNESGEVEGVFAAARDITERRRADEALRDSEERFRTLVSASKDAMIAVDRRGLITIFNPAAEQMFGRTREEMMGQPLDCLMPAEYREPHRRYVSGFFTSGAPSNAIGKTVELPALRRDGTMFPIELSLSTGQRGEEPFVLSVIRDITRRRRAEADLHRRDAILEAVAYAAQRFLKTPSGDEDIEAVLARLGRAMGVSRAYVFENHAGAGGELLVSQRHEWVAPGVTSQLDNPDTLGMPWHTGPMRRWAAILGSGEVVSGNVRDFPSSEQQVLTAQDVQSIAAVPVFVDQEWWGFIGFDECAREREWSAAEIEALKAAAGTWGAAIQRKRAEEALEKSEARFRGLVETTSDWVWEVDRSGVYTYASPQVRNLLGYAPEDVIGKTPFDLMPADEAERAAELFRDAVESRKPFADLVNTNLHRDGRYVVLETSGVPILGADGDLLGYRGIDRDITERKRAEDELRKFKTISDQAKYGAAITDLDGQLLYVNSALAEMHGYAPEELSGKHLSVLHTPEQMVRVNALNNALKREGSFNAEEVWHKRKDGQVFPTLMNATVIRDEHGTPMFLSATAIDITEHKRAEDEKARLTEQLQQAQKMRAVGQVTTGIAHDFGNLLAVARNALKRLQETALPPEEARETLTVIEEAVEEATSTTRSLLMFSRRLPGERMPLKMDKLVEDSAQVLRHLLPPAIELRLDTRCEQPCWIDGDPGQLQQVLLNLTLNARDAMPDGGTLAISVGPDRRDAPQAAAEGKSAAARAVRLTVGDTGASIAPQVLGRIFEPFFTTKPAGQGTGLGLAVVQSVVRDHGGRIEVHSQPGAGTTFTVTFPGVSFAPATGAAGRPEAVPAGRGALILLDEDNRHIRRLITATLRTWDYQVLAPAGGSSAAQAYEREGERVALLILNGDPPERRGFELVRQLRAAGRATPAIVTVRTADAQAQDQLDRDTVLLEKPFQMSELGACLGKLLAQRPAPGSR